jgi:hypothetical protein
MTSISRYFGQLVAYALLMAFVGYFSTSPAYTYVDPVEKSVVKLSLAHAGKIIGECREISEEQRKRFPPGARIPQDCPRERSDITIDFKLDGKQVFSQVIEPTGLSRDGAAYVYETFVVPAGEHELEVSMRDDVRTEGFDHVRKETVTLEGGRMLVIDFMPERGGFVLVR